MSLRLLRVPLLVALLMASAITPASAQVTAADSAAVLLDAARDFAAEGRWDVAEALYRLISERYPTSSAAAAARSSLDNPPAAADGSGSVELRTWSTLYGAWLGVAVPAAFGADSPEPYGAGILIGGPAGFLVGGRAAAAFDLSEGQARAITFGGTWGTWQGFGWREVFDLGVVQECSFGACYDFEESTEEMFGAMILGGVAGLGVGALLARQNMTAGTATAVTAAPLWGSWFGFAGGVLFDLEDDDLLAAALIGGNTTLLATTLLAPGWNVSRSRARLVSIAGVLGGLGGLGIDLLTQPDDEKVALGIPLAGSVLGLVVGVVATRPEGAVRETRGRDTDGALVGLMDGQLAFGVPAAVPLLLPPAKGSRAADRPALGLNLFRARF